MPKKPATAQRCPIDVFRYHDYRAFLSDFYAAKKRRGRGFSYRAFSRAAGLGAPNYLKLVISGQRNLTSAMAERFAATCGLGREASDYFVTLVAFNQANNTDDRNQHYQRLTSFRRYRRAQKLELAEAAYHSTWYLPAIRELCLSEHFRQDAEWIAASMWPPIKPAEARAALDTLLELGLLQRDESGKLRPKARVVSTGAQTAGMHLRNYHAEMMAHATAAMENVPAAQRDISSITMCVDPKVLPDLKDRIARFRRELVELCESGTRASQVVQINLQLFPLTHDVNPTTPAASDASRPKGTRK